MHWIIYHIFSKWEIWITAFAKWLPMAMPMRQWLMSMVTSSLALDCLGLGLGTRLGLGLGLGPTGSWVGPNPTQVKTQVSSAHKIPSVLITLQGCHWLIYHNISQIKPYLCKPLKAQAKMHCTAVAVTLLRMQSPAVTTHNIAQRCVYAQ